MPPPLKPETLKVIALGMPESGVRSEHTTKMFELAQPLHDAIDHAHDKMTAILRAVRSAKAVETHDLGRSMFSRIENSCETVLMQIKAAEQAIDHVTNGCRNLDDCMLDWKKSHDIYDARTTTTAVSASSTLDAGAPADMSK